MMQFIVLGQIPGTHFQLTYMWFWFVVLVVGTAGSAYLYRVHHAKMRKHLQRHFDAITLRTLDQA